jgi:cystathionine beta-lyase
MSFDFDTTVDRSGIGNMIEARQSQAIRAAGLSSYWGAEFGFRTAPAIVEALKKAADNGLFGYTVATPEYLDRVVWWFERRRGAKIRPEWILPSHGVIFSLASSIRAFTEPGEAIITLAPGYRRYNQAAERLGRKVVECPLKLEKGRYRIDFEDLETQMGESGRRILVLCNPNNPTGTVFGVRDLERIAELAERKGLLVYSDEIFAEIVFDGATIPPYHSVAGEGAECIVCSSLGKSFGLTGVNHANVLIPEAGLRDRFLLQRNADHYGSIDPFLHAALLGAYTEEGAAWLDAMLEYVWGNYLFVDSFFKERLPCVSVLRPEGTYVLWIDFRGLGLNAGELDRFLFEEALFCLDPGENYGAPAGYMRMNISLPRREIQRSLGFLAVAARERGLCGSDDSGRSEAKP